MASYSISTGCTYTGTCTYGAYCTCYSAVCVPVSVQDSRYMGLGSVSWDILPLPYVLWPVFFLLRYTLKSLRSWSSISRKFSLIHEINLVVDVPT